MFETQTGDVIVVLNGDDGYADDGKEVIRRNLGRLEGGVMSFRARDGLGV